MFNNLGLVFINRKWYIVEFRHNGKYVLRTGPHDNVQAAQKVLEDTLADPLFK